MRIRTLKPELLTDEKTAGLDDVEWRLFVSCILMADDYGNFRASPAALRAQAFWGTDATLETVANTREGLAMVSLVSLYEVNGQSYGHITGWSKHQRVDHPGKPYCPGPELGIPITCVESSRKSRESVANIPETLLTDRDRERDHEREREEEKNSPETETGETTPCEPAILTYPCDGIIKSWPLVESQLAEWRPLFPSVDLMAECRKALAWVQASPERRKTAKGMRKFLVGWFGRNQNSGGSRGIVGGRQRDWTVGGTRAEECEHPSTTGKVDL